MNTDYKPNEYLYSDITSEIISCFYKVYNKLGFGFLEKVYERAMLIESRKSGIASVNQVPIKVYYDEYEVGSFTADILVDDKIIVELKAAETMNQEFEYQLINYLKATDIEVGLVLNFGKKPEFKRKAFSNYNKNLRPS